MHRTAGVVRRVYKYATGQDIPEGAIYLSTIKQTSAKVDVPDRVQRTEWVPCWLVWHYFLVDDATEQF